MSSAHKPRDEIYSLSDRGSGRPGFEQELTLKEALWREEIAAAEVELTVRS